MLTILFNQIIRLQVFGRSSLPTRPNSDYQWMREEEQQRRRQREENEVAQIISMITPLL